MKTYTLPMGRLHATEHKTPERVAYRRERLLIAAQLVAAYAIVALFLVALTR